MTSLREGLPMCVLESMAFGVPIVSTPTDGVLSLIDDGFNGFLSDDNTVIAQKIINILQDKELHDYLSNNQIKKFNDVNDVDKYKRVMLGIYRNSVSEKWYFF